MLPRSCAKEHFSSIPQSAISVFHGIGSPSEFTIVNGLIGICTKERSRFNSDTVLGSQSSAVVDSFKDLLHSY